MLAAIRISRTSRNDVVIRGIIKTGRSGSSRDRGTRRPQSAGGNDISALTGSSINASLGPARNAERRGCVRSSGQLPVAGSWTSGAAKLTKETHGLSPLKREHSRARTDISKSVRERATLPDKLAM